MDLPDGDLRGRERRTSGDDAHNPVASWIQNCRARTRTSVADDTVERRAMYLQSGSSFTPWGKLPEADRELWRHLARVELVG